MKIDLHIHSKFSYDSLSDPLKILKIAKKKGLNAISITDHDTMAAYDKSLHLDGILLVPGMEITTDFGDIIGIFLSNEIKSRYFFDVIEEIRNQGGLAVLPHPFRRGKNPEDLCQLVDLIEVINARSNDFENKMAQECCERYGKKKLTGSDAHTYFEIGSTITNLEGAIQDLDHLKEAVILANRKCYGKITPFYLSHGCSFVTSRIKKWCYYASIHR
jgi:predicted metal-dependent phosphoesterase TrpH